MYCNESIFFKYFLPREIITHKETCHKGTPHYNLRKWTKINFGEIIRLINNYRRVKFNLFFVSDYFSNTLKDPENYS